MPDQIANENLSPLRVAVAILIALLGSVFIWVAVPYNNFLIQNTYLSDSFLPEIVVALLLLLVLAANPLLRLVGGRWMLNRRQLALISSLLLFSAILPSNGLMRMFPRVVAELNRGFNNGGATSRYAAEADLRQAQFPDPLPAKAPDGSIQTHDTPISSNFLDPVDPSAPVPWHAWIEPMATWGFLILAIWAMMVGLGGVVFPQWRYNERLSFPLLSVYQALIGDSDTRTGRVLPEVFRSRMFWIATGIVFSIHGMRALNEFTGAVPSIPLSWNLAPYFTESILRNAPWNLTSQFIFFSIVGVAYFIPNRYAISIWAWVLGYGLYQTYGRAYIPGFDDGQAYNQACGILLAIALWVIWLGRAHWARVGRAMFGQAHSDADAFRNAMAGWLFVIGCAGIMIWLNWSGCSLWWSLAATAGSALICLLIARIIAETAIPILWLTVITIGGLTNVFPLRWQSPTILVYTGVLYVLVVRTTAVSASVMSTLAMGMDRKASSKYQGRLLLGGLGVLVIGYVVCGAVHLNMGYHYDNLTTSAKLGASVVDRWESVARPQSWFGNPDRHNQLAGFGIGMALLWACSRFPSWPIHPVGILFIRTSIGHLVWFSIFLGWLCKTTVTQLFGSGMYRKCRPLFLGLVMGELLAIIFWAIVPLVIIWSTGADPSRVPRYTLIQYP